MSLQCHAKGFTLWILFTFCWVTATRFAVFYWDFVNRQHKCCMVVQRDENGSLASFSHRKAKRWQWSQIYSQWYDWFYVESQNVKIYTSFQLARRRTVQISVSHFSPEMLEQKLVDRGASCFPVCHDLTILLRSFHLAPFVVVVCVCDIEKKKGVKVQEVRTFSARRRKSRLTAWCEPFSRGQLQIH